MNVLGWWSKTFVSITTYLTGPRNESAIQKDNC